MTDLTPARRITWFAPERPVEGTVYVRPTESPDPRPAASGETRGRHEPAERLRRVAELAAAARITHALTDAVDAAGGWAKSTHTMRGIADLLNAAAAGSDPYAVPVAASIAAALLAAARRELATPEVRCPPRGVTLDHVTRWVHDAIEGLDRECDDVGEGALCQHIALWVLEAMESEERPALPTPRVWLPGDTVPAGVWAVDETGPIDEYREHVTRVPLVEVFVLGFADAVAAEQARRAATEVGDP